MTTVQKHYTELEQLINKLHDSITSEWVINNYDGGAGLGQHDLLDEALHKIQDAKALYEQRKKL